jgi:hypothetical protein
MSTSLKRAGKWCLVVVAWTIVAGVAAFALSDSVRFVVCSLTQYALYGQPSEQDREDAKDIVGVITRSHDFQMDSRSTKGQPPVFVNAGCRRLLTQRVQIQIYDVLNRVEQDRIIVSLQGFIRNRNLRPVQVQFLVYENWIVNGSFGSRGPETQIRRVIIDAKHVKEEAGTEQISYPSP